MDPSYPSNEHVSLQQSNTSSTASCGSYRGLGSSATIGSHGTTIEAPASGNRQTEQQLNTAAGSQTPLSAAIRPNATDPITEVLSEYPEETAEKMARWSIILCILSTVIMIIAGVPFAGHDIMLITLFAIWMFLKLLITIKRQLSQAHFVRREVRARKPKRSILQIPTAPSTSGQSGPSSILSTNGSSPGTAPSLSQFIQPSSLLAGKTWRRRLDRTLVLRSIGHADEIRRRILSSIVARQTGY
jgi:hypothetical protein